MICTDKICHATIPNVDACIKVIRQGQIDIHGVFIYPTSADPKLIHFIDLIDANIQPGACLNVLELVKITPSQIVALLRKHDDIIHGEFAVGHNLYRAVFAIVLFECFPGAVELLAILDFDINEVVGILLDKYEVIAVMSEMVNQPISAMSVIGHDNGIAIKRKASCSDIAAKHSFVISEGAVFVEGDCKTAPKAFSIIEIGFSGNIISVVSAVIKQVNHFITSSVIATTFNFMQRLYLQMNIPSIIGIYTILAILQNAIIVTGSPLMSHKYGIAISIRRQLADFLLRHILQRIQIVG